MVEGIEQLRATWEQCRADLRACEARFRSIIEKNADGIIIVDQDGWVQFVNPAAEALFTRSADALLGEPFGFPCIVGETAELDIIRRAGEITVAEMRVVETEWGGEPAYLASLRDITHRKRAEDALRESEARFRLLAENAQDLVYRIRLAPTMAFEYVSPAATAITGYTPEEHYANPSLGFELVHPQDRALLVEMQQSPEALADPLVLRWVRKDGTIIWTEQRNTLIFDDEGTLVAIEGIARDVTERKRAEEALRTSEQRYRELYEYSRDGIVSTDMEGNFQECNPAYAEMLGYTIEALRHKRYPELTPEKWHEWEAELVEKQIIAKGYSGLYEKEYIRKDGTVFPVELSTFLVRDEEGRPRGMWAIVRDITDRKQAENELRKARDVLEQQVQQRVVELRTQYARLNAILHSTSDGILVTDGEGQIIQANPVAQAWLAETLSSQEAERLRWAVQALVQRVEELPEMMVELAGLDLELNAAPVAAEDVEEPMAVVSIHDVSHLKTVDRMKTVFLSNISDELRQPVSTIKSFAYLLQRTTPGDENWREYLDALVQEVERQARMVEEIMYISRMYTGNLTLDMRLASLSDLCDVALSNNQAFAQKRGVMLEHDLSHPGLLAVLDARQILQVLNKLVRDAVRYTPAGGRVVVSARDAEVDGWPWVTISVLDTGERIPAEDLPHVFERFFRQEEPRARRISETGLSLMIAQGIAELHRGRTTVESPTTRWKGREAGATFTLWIPQERERE